MATTARYLELVEIPRAARFPIELDPPQGFDPAALQTWPHVSGRLEFVDGRLLFMPPCGDRQQDTVADVVITLGVWVRSRPGFVLGTNEAGMHLGRSTRAADAAIWRQEDAGARTGKLRTKPPVLAVEVAGTEEAESQLRDKARWYLEAGVAVVWIVLPESREVLVATARDERRLGRDEVIPETPELPGLSPRVRELFLQIEQG